MIFPATVVNGVIRWASNGAVPPGEDSFDELAQAGYVFDRAKSRAARAADNRSFLKEYRRRNARRKPSGEELYEMRAAFGPGTTVVNVITGRRTKL